MPRGFSPRARVHQVYKVCFKLLVDYICCVSLGDANQFGACVGGPGLYENDVIVRYQAYGYKVYDKHLPISGTGQ